MGPLFLACSMMVAFVGGEAHADSKPKKSAKASKKSTKAAIKPWAAPGWLERYTTKAVSIDEEFKVIPGGRDVLLFAAQIHPEKNLDRHFKSSTVAVVSGTGEAMDADAYRRHDYIHVRNKDGELEVWRLNAGGTVHQPPVSGSSGGPPTASRYEHVDASTVKPGCAGMISREAAQPIWLDAGVPDLRLFATPTTAEQAASLLVATPSGELHCHYDPAGTDAKIELTKPAPGMYSVWVGRSAPDSATLLFVSVDRKDKFESRAMTAAQREADTAARVERAHRSSGDSGRNEAFRKCTALARGASNGRGSMVLAKCMKDRGY